MSNFVYTKSMFDKRITESQKTIRLNNSICLFNFERNVSIKFLTIVF